MGNAPDIQRLVGDIARAGTIASVDLAAARCTVSIGDLVTGPIPWVTGRAGGTSIWSHPTVGEQVLLICPEGDTAAGVALLGIYSDANPAGVATEKLDQLKFADGSVISYDAETHALLAILADDGTATITAPGGLTINGPVRIVGDVDLQGGMTARDDVTASGISVKGHLHDKVKAGTDKSGTPVSS